MNITLKLIFRLCSHDLQILLIGKVDSLILRIQNWKCKCPVFI